MFGNQWFRKESPLLSLIGLGGGGLTAGSSDTGISATGGQTTTYTSQGVQYKAHKFTSSGSFAVSSLGSLGGDTYFAVVAGGGGGAHAQYSGGGGGAGGVRVKFTGSPITMPGAFPVSGPATYPVTVGGGGAASSGPNSSPTGTNGANGSESYLGPPSTPQGFTATGGGGGGMYGTGGHAGGSGIVIVQYQYPGLT